MKFGVTIPNNWGIDDPQQVLAMGPLAEQLGYDSVWVMDHLFNNGYIRERLDDKPIIILWPRCRTCPLPPDELGSPRRCWSCRITIRWSWPNMPPRWTTCLAGG